METGRTIFYDYFEVDQLPVGDIPYSAIQRALKHEKYFRRFTPTFCRNDLMQGHLAALLYWYPHILDQLYNFAAEDQDYMVYFKALPNEITEGFKYLFPEVEKKLDKARQLAIDLNSLEEIKLNRRKA